ncbi:Uncharacterised protein [Bacillus subtilis]|nr:Uncharacterised protein [Bacillus subtilis]
MKRRKFSSVVAAVLIFCTDFQPFFSGNQSCSGRRDRSGGCSGKRQRADRRHEGAGTGEMVQSDPGSNGYSEKLTYGTDRKE